MTEQSVVTTDWVAMSTNNSQEASAAGKSGYTKEMVTLPTTLVSSLGPGHSPFRRRDLELHPRFQSLKRIISTRHLVFVNDYQIFSIKYYDMAIREDVVASAVCFHAPSYKVMLANIYRLHVRTVPEIIRKMG